MGQKTSFERAYKTRALSFAASLLPSLFLVRKQEEILMDFLTEEEVSELREAFCLFDMNGDGSECITVEEMTAIVKSLGRSSSNEELREMMSQIHDANVRGNYDFKDFLDLATKNTEEVNKEDELREVFNVFDGDQNGYISAGELKYVLMRLGEKLTDEEAEQMIKEADFDGDGKVNYDDFVRTMMSI